ncbi:MAG: DUF1028 domain-containing protein [Actinomycetia bacterium]|nr:DUF1028 domain-containing protein [Actinomycetes bacterium]
MRVLVVSMVAVVSMMVALTSPAEATWSIVAADPESAEVGAAIASCVPVEVLGRVGEPLVPIIVIPGVAIGVTQAQMNLDAPARIRELVAAGATPREIIDELTSPSFDEVASLRQHAIVRLPSDVAAATGADNSPEALDQVAEGVSVQGNLLVSTAVVDDAMAAFLDAAGANTDLASALVDGLVAGSAAGGDRRCGDQTALFAQLVVAKAGDDPSTPSTLLTVSVDQGDGQNPVALLADAFLEGRTGVIDAGASEPGSGGLVRILVLVVAGLMVVVSLVALKRGMGSVSARR